MPRKTQREKRLERAELVCREVRHCIATRGDPTEEVLDLLLSWMRIAPKSKYKRPTEWERKRCLTWSERQEES